MDNEKILHGIKIDGEIYVPLREGKFKVDIDDSIYTISLLFNKDKKVDGEEPPDLEPGQKLKNGEIRDLDSKGYLKPKRDYCAVFRVECVPENRIYIGASKYAQQRLYDHKSQLNKNKHWVEQMQADWNKYGPDAFKFEIQEECEKEDLFARKKYWINQLESDLWGYNTLPGYKQDGSPKPRDHRGWYDRETQGSES